MKYLGLLLAFALALPLGCSSGVDSDRVARELSGCSADAMLDFLSIVIRLGDVTREAQGIDRSFITLTPTINANEFDFVADYDLNADGTPETQLAGVMTLSTAPGSITTGESATFDLTQVSSAVPGATGVFTLEFERDGVLISGSATLEGDLGCDTTLTFDALAPVRADIGRGALLAGLEPSFAFPAFGVAGTFLAEAARGRETLASMVTYDGSEVVAFRNNTLNGEDFADISVSYPPQSIFDTVHTCATSGVSAVDRIVDLVDTLTLAVRVGAPTINGESYSFDAVAGAANTFSFSLRDGDATFSGTIAYPVNPVGVEVSGAVTISNWVSTLIGLSGGVGPVEARALAPMIVNFDSGDVVSHSGTTTIVNPAPNCVASVTIPHTAPLTDNSGTMRVVVTASVHSFGATFHFSPEIVVVTDNLLNENTFPGTLLSAFLD